MDDGHRGVESMAQNAVRPKLPTGIENHSNYLRIVFYYRGVRYRESLGLPVTKQNINFAKCKREAIIYEIKIGTFSYAAHFPNSKHAFGRIPNQKIDPLTQKFLHSKEFDIRKSTYQRYDWVLRDFIEGYGSNRSVDTLSPRTLMEFRQSLVKGKNGRTINRNLVTINAFLAWLFKMEYISQDLSKILTRVKEPPTNIKPFTMEEVKKVLSVCHQLQHSNMFTTLVYTGIRTGELCTLAWEDVDFTTNTLLIRRSAYTTRGLKTTKTDKERYVDLLPPAIDALKKQRSLTYLYPAKTHQIELPGNSYRSENLRFVFNPKVIRAQKGSDYDYYGTRALSRIWKELCLKANIEYRSQYQLRHTYASWMITHANINISYLAQQLGHADITMIAKVYGKWLIESNKQESERVWKKLQNAQLAVT